MWGRWLYLHYRYSDSTAGDWHSPTWESVYARYGFWLRGWHNWVIFGRKNLALMPISRHHWRKYVVICAGWLSAESSRFLQFAFHLVSSPEKYGQSRAISPSIYQLGVICCPGWQRFGLPNYNWELTLRWRTDATEKEATCTYTRSFGIINQYGAEFQKRQLLQEARRCGRTLLEEIAIYRSVWGPFLKG